VIRQHRLRIPQDEELFDELASVRLTSPPASARAAAVLGLALAGGSPPRPSPPQRRPPTGTPRSPT